MISFVDVKRMLDHCAPGHEIYLKTHFRIIRWNRLTYPTLPKHADIEAGHVKKLARALGIRPCASQFLQIR
jgi:hypothetical protein